MPKQTLTSEQYAQYRKAHQRLLRTLSIAVVYCVGFGVVDEFVSLERFGLFIAIALFPITGLVIWGMMGFRCPACGSAPRAKAASLSSSEVAYSSMIALFPEKCSSCGIRFEPPTGEPET